MHDRQRLLSIIAPCLNEEANVRVLCERTLAAVDRLPVSSELVLVDDGSTDATWTEIQCAGKIDPRVRGVRHETNRGIAHAWSSGLAASRGELVCLIDADLQNRPEDIAGLLAAYDRGGATVVQGVRRPVCFLHRHRLFTRGLNALLNAAFGTRLRDHKSGFVLCRRETLAALLRRRFQYRYFQAFIGAAAAARKLSIREVDTMFDPRTAGQSFLSRFPIGPSLRIVWELAKFRTETWLDALGEARPQSSARPLLTSREFMECL